MINSKIWEVAHVVLILISKNSTKVRRCLKIWKMEIKWSKIQVNRKAWWIRFIVYLRFWNLRIRTKIAWSIVLWAIKLTKRLNSIRNFLHQIQTWDCSLLQRRSKINSKRTKCWLNSTKNSNSRSEYLMGKVNSSVRVTIQILTIPGQISIRHVMNQEDNHLTPLECKTLQCNQTIKRLLN